MADLRASAGMKNHLVTVFGGGGFIGRHVVQALLRDGARVRIAQRDPRQAWFLRTHGSLGRVQLVAADVTRPDTVAHAVAGADAVVNLVGVFGGNIQGIHVDGARTIAAAATAEGTRALVHMSAIGADPASASGYGRSKGEGEVAVRDAFPAATILRPSVVFGAEDAFINRFAGLIAKAPIVPVLRSGTNFQPVFVGDVAGAVAAALIPIEHQGRTLDLGGPDIITMGALMRWIADAIGRRPAFIELPDFAGGLIARAGFLPGAPITWDQWLMLQSDNVAADDGLSALGVTPTPLGAVAPGFLVRFRRQGRFAGRADTLA